MFFAMISGIVLFSEELIFFCIGNSECTHAYHGKESGKVCPNLNIFTLCVKCTPQY